MKDKTSGKQINTMNSADNLAFVVLLGLIAMFVSIGYLLIQIYHWLRTAEWDGFTSQQSLAQIRLIDQLFILIYLKQ